MGNGCDTTGGGTTTTAAADTTAGAVGATDGGGGATADAAAGDGGAAVEHKGSTAGGEGASIVWCVPAAATPGLEPGVLAVPATATAETVVVLLKVLMR